MPDFQQESETIIQNYKCKIVSLDRYLDDVDVGLRAEVSTEAGSKVEVESKKKSTILKLVSTHPTSF